MHYESEQAFDLLEWTVGQCSDSVTRTHIKGSRVALALLLCI